MYIYPREVLEDEISVLVAGALAEDAVLGSRSTGASNDFERALDIAKRIVSYGMSPLGVVDRDTASPDALAKATREILERCQAKSGGILAEHKGTVERIATALADKESVSGDELRDLLAVPNTGVIKHTVQTVRKIAEEAQKPFSGLKILKGKTPRRLESSAQG